MGYALLHKADLSPPVLGVEDGDGLSLVRSSASVAAPWSLPVWDLLLSQLQAHEHRAAGEPQEGVEVDGGLCLRLASHGGLEERGIKFCLEIDGEISPAGGEHASLATKQ